MSTVEQQPLYGAVSSDERPTAAAGTPAVHKLYRARFAMLLIFFVFVFIQGFCSNSFAVIQNVVISTYGVTTLQENVLPLAILIVGTPVGFIGGYIFQKGLKFGLLVAGVSLVLGTWIRYLAAYIESFPLLVVGQMVMSVAPGLGASGCTLLSENWFPQDGRAESTAVGGLANIIGSVAASIVVPGFFTKGASRAENNHDFRRFMFVDAMLASVSTLVVLLWFRDKPPTPPSASSAEHDVHEHKQTAWELIRIALTNPAFIVLCVGFGCGFASVNAVITLINQILHPIGYTNTEIGNIGAGLGMGVIGSVIAAILMDRTGRFLLIGRTCAVLALGGFIGFTVVLFAEPVQPRPVLAFVTMSLTGLFGLPLVPLMMEIGVEVLFPLSEALSTSLLITAGNVFGVVAVVVATLMEKECKDVPGSDDCVHPKDAMLPAMYFLGAVFAVAVGTTVFFKGKLKRREYEEEHPDM